MPKTFLDCVLKQGPDDADIPYLRGDTFGKGIKVVGGLGTLVSGTVSVATGLSTLLAFNATVRGTTYATGATECCGVAVSGTPATGAVQVTGFVLGTSVLSVSGTNPFYWLALGY